MAWATANSRTLTTSTAAYAPSLTLSAVVPVYDEAAILPELYRRLTAVFAALGVDYELVFVNDGSQDDTPALLDDLAGRDARVAVLHLSRNFGHQAALTAGLEQARGEAVVALDGDLQDPPELIPALLERWREGYDVVYAIRTRRKEGALKRLSYYAFYRLFRGMAEVDMPVDAGDFCLMDHRVVRALNLLPERSRFIRGLRAYLGFRQVGVPYEREARWAGRAKYTWPRLFSLALDGLFGFSSAPARAMLGLSALSALAAGLVALVACLPPVSALLGLAAMLLALAAGQFACLGGITWYLTRILAEVRGRPVYIIDRFVRTVGRPAETRVGEP